MSEPTREEWASWAAAIEEETAPDYYGLLQLLGFVSPESYQAAIIQQAAAMRGTILGQVRGMYQKPGRGISGILGGFGSALDL